VTGHDFEEICKAQMDREQTAGRAIQARCGVQGALIEGVWQPIESKPDFEGAVSPLGRQFTYDAKVCSQSSFSLSKYRAGNAEPKTRQFKYLMDRSDFGVTSFLLIHFPERILQTRTDLEQTWAFPVCRDHPFWQAFAAGTVSSISRADCQKYAVRVSWEIFPKCRVSRPDILTAVLTLMGLRGNGQQASSETEDPPTTETESWRPPLSPKRLPGSKANDAVRHPVSVQD
jgi:penicillin-binding protein-related factor A (putative recombinase)